MTKPKRLSRPQKLAINKVAGHVPLDIFGHNIIVFSSQADVAEYFQAFGMEFLKPSSSCMAYAGWARTPDDVRCYYMMLPPGIPLGVYVHEASHIVDFVLDHMGIPLNMKNTEIRAYMIEHIFTVTCEIMADQNSEPTPVAA